MGTLVGAVAHDFNNILNVIQGYSSLIASHAGDNPEIGESIKVINEAVQRGADVVQQLLTIARKGEVSLQPADINNLVAGVRELLNGSIPKNIAVHWEFADNLPPVLADAHQMTQALVNLCQNARDAMSEGGALTLRTRLAPEPPGQLNRDAKNEDFVLVEVADSGSGMDEAVRNRVFEPFFTTKPSEKSTGLGLAVVYGIVRNHNGAIEVESAPGRGSTFRIALPVAPAEEASSDRACVTSRNSGGDVSGDRHATALVVEDEEAMLHLLRNILAERGYRVFTAVDGEEAAVRYHRNGDDIDVVLLDLDLPKISGTEVLRKIRARNPNARVVITSGYLEPELKAALVREGVTRFIHKPYEPEEIIAALEAEDDRRSESAAEENIR